MRTIRIAMEFFSIANSGSIEQTLPDRSASSGGCHPLRNPCCAAARRLTYLQHDSLFTC